MKIRKLSILALTICCLTLLTGCGGEGGGGDPAAKLPGTPDGNANAVIKSMQEGQPAVVFAAMPDSYQKDVTALVHTFAGKMDSEVYDKVFTVIGKIGSVMRDKKDFILNTPELKDN